MSRAAVYSGTFFSHNLKKQFEIQNVGNFTVIIDLFHSGIYFGERWSTDVTSNPDTKQALINAILASDKTKTTPGYEKALQKSIENYDPSLIVRVNQTRLIITVPAMPEYLLPKYDKVELVAALDIPQAAVVGQMPVTQRLGVSTLTISGIGELANASVAIPTAGVEGDVMIGFSTRHEIESTGKIIITAPSRNAFVSGFIIGNTAISGVSGVLSGSISVAVSGQQLTLTGFNRVLIGPMVFNLTNIRSPASHVSDSWRFQTVDKDEKLIDEKITALQVTPLKNAMRNVVLSCDETQGRSICLQASQGVPNAGASSTITFSVTTIGQILDVGMIKVYFPVGFIVGNSSTISGLSGITGNATTSISGQVLMISGFNTVPAGRLSFTLSEIRSHANKLSTTFQLATTDDFGNIFDDTTSGLHYTPSQGNLTKVAFACDAAMGTTVCDNATRGVPNAGVEDKVIISYETFASVPMNGQIKITFPAEFQLNTPELSPHHSINLPSQVNISTVGQVVILNGFSSPVPNGLLQYAITNVRSHAEKPSRTFQIVTTDVDGYIYDQKTNGLRFTPAPGNVTNVTMRLPNAGVIDTLVISLRLAGQVEAAGFLRVTVPSDYALGMFNQASGLLEFPATVYDAEGTLGGPLQIRIDVATNTAIISGFNTIQPGQMTFKLGFVKPGSGTAGSFFIQTTDRDGNRFDDSRFGNEAGPATSEAGVAPTFGSLGSVGLFPPNAGSLGSMIVQMTTLGEVESSGKIMLTFPAGYDITGAQAVAPSGRLWLSTTMATFTNQTAASCALKTDCGGGIILVSGFKTIAPGALSFTLEGIRSPATGIRPFIVQTGDSLGFVIDQSTGVPVSASTGTLQEVFVRVQNAGVEGDVDFRFTTLGRVPPDGSIKITFPSHTASGYPAPFVLGAVSIYKPLGKLTGNLAVSVTGQQVVISGLDVLYDGLLGFTLTNVRSPGSTASATFEIESSDANGLVLDKSPDNVTATPAIGQLYNVHLQVPLAGESGPLNVSFATQGTILGRGRIKILCPAGVKLLQPLRVSHAVGALSSATSFDVEV